MLALAQALRAEVPVFRGCHGGWVHPAACYAAHVLGGPQGRMLAHSLICCEDGHTVDEILEDIEALLEGALPLSREEMIHFFDLRTPGEAAELAESRAGEMMVACCAIPWV